MSKLKPPPSSNPTLFHELDVVVVNYTDYIMHRYKPAIILAVDYYLASIEGVSVWFQSKERPRNRIFRFGRARNGTGASPIFCPVFDSLIFSCSMPRNCTEMLAAKANCNGRNRPLQILCVSCNNQSGSCQSLLHFIPRNIDLAAKPEKKNNTESFCNKWKTFSYLIT